MKVYINRDEKWPYYTASQLDTYKTDYDIEVDIPSSDYETYCEAMQRFHAWQHFWAEKFEVVKDQ